MHSKRTKITGFIAGYVLILFFVVAVSAAVPTPGITRTTVDYTTNQLTVIGQAFSPYGGTPTVTFNGSTLSVLSYSNAQLIAALPSGLAAATYRLTVASRAVPNQPAIFDVTLGAAGHAGPQGPQGFMGPQGPAGAQGIPGVP